MRVLLLTLAICFSACSSAEPPPQSLILWKNQAEFSDSLKTTSDAEYKKALFEYYRSVFSGKRRAEIGLTITHGHLESSYFAEFFDELRFKEISFSKAEGANRYVAQTKRRPCYYPNFSSPRMDMLVKNYRITNASQSKVNQWLRQSPDSSFCLDIETMITFGLDDKGLINEEKWSVEKSVIEFDVRQ